MYRGEYPHYQPTRLYPSRGSKLAARVLACAPSLTRSTYRSYGVIRQVIESTFVELGQRLPPDDFEEMSRMVKRLNEQGA